MMAPTSLHQPGYDISHKVEYILHVRRLVGQGGGNRNPKVWETAELGGSWRSRMREQGTGGRVNWGNVSSAFIFQGCRRHPQNTRVIYAAELYCAVASVTNKTLLAVDY